jgi:hypothetical protein
MNNFYCLPIEATWTYCQKKPENMISYGWKQKPMGLQYVYKARQIMDTSLLQSRVKMHLSGDF